MANYKILFLMIFLKDFIDYVDSWLAPTVKEAIAKLGKDRVRLNAGLVWFRSIRDRHNGVVSATIYRASGTSS